MFQVNVQNLAIEKSLLQSKSLDSLNKVYKKKRSESPIVGQEIKNNWHNIVRYLLLYTMFNKHM